MSEPIIEFPKTGERSRRRDRSIVFQIVLAAQIRRGQPEFLVHKPLGARFLRNDPD
jgi:hypothetical protein